MKSNDVSSEFLTGENHIFTATKFHEMNFYPARMDGRSGRGDTCVGTYIAKRLSLNPREAGIWAAAVTSLKMENLGPCNRSISAVEAFIHARYNHGSIL